MTIFEKFRRAVGSHKSNSSTSSSSSTYSPDADTCTLSSTESYNAPTANMGMAAAPTPAEAPCAGTSGATGSTTVAPASASPNAEPSSVIRKSPSRIFSWRSSKGSSDEKKKGRGKKRSHSPDPREKPFTETNLRFQEILGSYELTFGTRRTEQLWDGYDEISPCTSRQNSLELRRY